MRLTVQERILLHLLPYGRVDEAPEAPVAVARQGVAEACWISQRHLSQYVRPLVEKGHVTEWKAHVRGVRQRRKVYALTGSGRRRAKRLHERVLSTPLQVQDDGGTREVTIAEAISNVGGSVPPLQVLRLAARGEPISLEDLERQAAPPRVEMTDDAPQIGDFVGRATELEALTEAGGPPLFVVRGVAGIGKSSLAARACAHLRGERDLFWHRVRPWDSRDSILSRLAAFLARLGKPGLQAVLMRGQAGRAAEVLREDLPGTGALLVFDDVHRADSDVQPFFRFLLEALVRADDVRAIVLTRHALPFYSRQDVVVEGVVQELELQGLEPREVAAYLSHHELSERAVEAAQHLHGHPLFLELLRAHNTVSEVLDDVHRYLEEEVYADLQEAERGMMKVASLYRVPVPREALFADPEWTHDVLLSLRNRSLLRGAGQDSFEAHDTIRDFFSGLPTSAELKAHRGFVVEQLRTLASEAQEADEPAQAAGYLSNAIELSTVSHERAALWESLGDANLRLGDLLAVSVAFRSAARLASDPETRSRAHRKMAFAHNAWGELRSAADEIEEGFRALGTRRGVEEGWLHLARSEVCIGTAKARKAEEEVDTALAVFREFKDARGEAIALIWRAHVLTDLGAGEERLPSARKGLNAALELAAGLDDPELAARAHIWMAQVLAMETGDSEEAQRHLAAVEDTPGILENHRIRIEFFSQRAVHNGARNVDFEARAADCRELIRVARGVRDDYGLAYGQYLLATTEVINGRPDRARALWEEAAVRWRGFGNLRMLPNTLFHIARACLMEGDLAGFRQVRKRMEDPSLEKAVGVPLYPRVLLALDLFLQGEWTSSSDAFEAELRNLQAQADAHGGYKKELARTRLLYGVALHLMGNEGDARDLFQASEEQHRTWHRPGHVVEAEVERRHLLDGMRRILRSASVPEAPSRGRE
ncbi:MAG: AAA family ATPase [Thermoplasmata archaeon]